MVAPAPALSPWPRPPRSPLSPGPGALLLLLALAGCSPVGLAVGAGAAVGVQASQERGLGTALSDDRIWAEIQAGWLDNDADMFRKLQLQVHEGRVLVTGVVQKPEMRMTAIRIAWGVEGVKQVIAEIKVAEASDLGQDIEDEWLAQKLRTKILFDNKVRSINYSVEAVEGTIYLMGIAQSEAELQRVIDHARDIAYVRKVVSYVRIKGEPPPPAPGETEPALSGPARTEPAPTGPAQPAPALPTSTQPSSSPPLSPGPVTAVPLPAS